MSKAQGFQRARSADQKEQRRAAILAAAAELLERDGLAAVSLNGIAREVGLAKSNVYRYFESREQIFLELLREDWTTWLAAVEARLAPLAGTGDARAVAAALAATFVERPRLCVLVSSLATVLERNLSVDTIVAFKQDALGLGIRLANSLHAAVPALTVADCWRFARAALAMMTGLWAMANPAPAVREAMKRPELALHRSDFSADLEHGLGMLLLGAQAS